MNSSLAVFVPIESSFNLLCMPTSPPSFQRRCLHLLSAMAWTRKRGFFRILTLLQTQVGLRSYGPLIHSNAVAKVEAHVKDAISRGATVLVGGKKLDSIGPNFYAPTVLSDVSPDSQNFKEETFGPVATLTKFDTEEEVIKMANNTEVGLAGYFYARDIGRVWRVAEKLEVGMVGINTGLVSAAIAPFGGVKETGYGREGAHGIEEYLNTKFISFGGL